MFVLKRIDQRRGYVTPNGSPHSYTPYIRQARIFKTREEAEGQRCVQNEVIILFQEARK